MIEDRMRNTISVIAFLLLGALSVSAQQPVTPELSPQHRLMPVPATLRFQGGRLNIESSFRVAVDGYSDARLQAGLHRATLRLERRTGMEFLHTPASDSQAAGLLIQCGGPGKLVPSVDEDESYSLDVSDSRALLKAQTVVGVLRGLETFLQLLEGDGKGYFIPTVSIQDKPRFQWRGLLIDIARRFEPIEVIKRNLDAMAAVKLNVLHWH